MSCRLRAIRVDDLEMVRQWRMLPDVTRYMYSDPVISPEDQRSWFEHIVRSERDLAWIIELADEQAVTPVGLLSLGEIDRVHQRCSWAYYLGSDAARGKGLAKVLELNIYRYVFEELKLNKLWCEVLAFNDRVVALHERFGSRVEGMLRQHIHKHGEWHDVVRMAVLAEDWPGIRARFQFDIIPIE